MEPAMKSNAKLKEKRPRAAAKKVALDPFQELEDLEVQARTAPAGARALLENLLANKQEDYEIAASSDRNDPEKQKLAKAALAALMKVRKARVTPDEG